MTTNRAVFSGIDDKGNVNLWVTDGTAKGTTELSVSGAFSGGLLAVDEVPDPDFTVLGDQVLFRGASDFGVLDLWVTDGTGGDHSAGAERLEFLWIALRFRARLHRSRAQSRIRCN
jgi:Tol biopolymer transport system component